MDQVAEAVVQARATLERCGLLLFSDPALPSLVGIVVGEPLHRSWFDHPLGPIIYRAMNKLDEDHEVLSTKLIASKVTYVHKRLWPAVFAIGSAREAWQMDPLSPGAKWLLEELDAEGEVQTDVVALPRQTPGRIKDAARELEHRLLVHATEVHTPSGAHAKVLQTWSHWSRQAQFRATTLTANQGREQLEQAANQLTAGVPDGKAKLPWQPSTRRRRQ